MADLLSSQSATNNLLTPLLLSQDSPSGVSPGHRGNTSPSLVGNGWHEASIGGQKEEVGTVATSTQASHATQKSGSRTAMSSDSSKDLLNDSNTGIPLKPVGPAVDNQLIPPLCIL